MTIHMLRTVVRCIHPGDIHSLFPGLWKAVAIAAKDVQDLPRTGSTARWVVPLSWAHGPAVHSANHGPNFAVNICNSK